MSTRSGQNRVWITTPEATHDQGVQNRGSLGDVGVAGHQLPRLIPDHRMRLPLARDGAPASSTMPRVAARRHTDEDPGATLARSTALLAPWRRSLGH